MLLTWSSCCSTRVFLPLPPSSVRCPQSTFLTQLGSSRLQMPTASPSGGAHRGRIVTAFARDEDAGESTEGSASSANCSLQEARTVDEIKGAVIDLLQGINRGIFGVDSKKKAKLGELIELLESTNPCPRPTDNMEMLKGEWRLLYTTLTILGRKRTKLGLRDFITVGDFLQAIDVEHNKAVNTIWFSVCGLRMLTGSLRINATYRVSSPTQVVIQYEESAIVPEELLGLFQKKYDLLLSVFNPEGWLEITYFDNHWRVGRDDKGNLFLVERTT